MTRQAPSYDEILARRRRRRAGLIAGALVTMLATMAIVCRGDDAALALADRDAQPLDRQPFLRYVTTAPIAEDWREHAACALALIVPSMSRQPVLEHCLPERVEGSDTLYRLDLAPIDQGGLGWDLSTWADVVAEYPYRLGTVQADGRRDSLTVRADWLLVTLTDQHESQVYYPLVFGAPAPTTRDEIFARLGVDADPRLQFGMIEGASGVSVQGHRLIRNLGVSRGYAWLTNDYKTLGPDQDPLEQPENDARHDGEEGIIGIRKIHLASGTQGALQVYFLANGQGQLVDRAPVDLVEDHSRFRRLAEIRNAGSCIGCHLEGLNPLKRNELRAVQAAGVADYAQPADKEAVEAFHFADLTVHVRRDNEDFAAIVRLACQCEPYEASYAFQTIVAEYDKPLTFADAARELGRQPAELKLALGYASASGYRLGRRLASLAHEQSVPRRAFEPAFLGLLSLCEQWENQR